MRLSDILSVQRIFVAPSGGAAPQAGDVLETLSWLLSEHGPCDRGSLLNQLREREKLQSTGIGDGVAIPHTSLPELKEQVAALYLCDSGVDFQSIDQKPTKIFFAVVGPKSAASAHLKILAKISRLLQSPETRRRLLGSIGAEQAYALIEEQDASQDAK